MDVTIHMLRMRMKMRKPTVEDFKIVDKGIDSLIPEYESKGCLEIRKIRRAWGRILLYYGGSKT